MLIFKMISKENGLLMYLWIGINVDPTVIQNLFGVAGTQQLNTEKCKLLELNTKISENVRSVIKTVNEQRKANLKVSFVFAIFSYLNLYFEM
jgi:protein transport protein SEC24